LAEKLDKAREAKEAMLDVDYIQRQLRSSKVIEVLKLRQLGFPVRSYFDDFYTRYKMFIQSMSDHEGNLES